MPGGGPRLSPRTPTPSLKKLLEFELKSPPSTWVDLPRESARVKSLMRPELRRLCTESSAACDASSGRGATRHTTERLGATRGAKADRPAPYPPRSQPAEPSALTGYDSPRPRRPGSRESPRLELGGKAKKERRAHSAGVVAERPRLHLSANNKTGYLYVTEKASHLVGAPSRFQAFVRSEATGWPTGWPRELTATGLPKGLSLGTYGTAVEAAVAVARHFQAQGRQGQQEQEEEEQEEQEEQEEEEEEEEGRVE